MSGTATPGLTSLASFQVIDFTQEMVRQWAVAESGGGLPAVSADAFAQWLNEVWNGFDDGTGTQTNEDILTGAWKSWTGRS